MPILTPAGWDEYLGRHQDAHILQSRQWGDLKSAFGWQALRVGAGQAGAQVLIRSLPLGFSLAYLPKGPIGPDWDMLWPEIDRICRRHRSAFLKVEPDLWEGDQGSTPAPPAGFRRSAHSIQPPRTIRLDLRQTEEQILAGMKQKTRYNVRLAGRKEVQVRPSSDLQVFSELMAQTGKRDGFPIHSPAYYQQAYDQFHPLGGCELLFAEVQDEPVAALMVFARGRRAWYFYGASSGKHRNRMPAYSLQWEAIRWARAQGCHEYDLWGIPDESPAALEAGFLDRRDGLWGVYRFKRGFGGQITRAAGPWDRVYNPVLYRLYTWWVQRQGPP